MSCIVGYILNNMRPYLGSDQFLSATVRRFPHRVTWQFIFPIVRLALQSLMCLCIARRTEAPIKNKTHRLAVYILNYMFMLAVGTTIMWRSRDACVRGQSIGTKPHPCAQVGHRGSVSYWTEYKYKREERDL